MDNYQYERELRKQGITLIAGVDEVGRGPLVGPVVTACVILPEKFELPGLTDSKKLSEKVRESLYDIIFGASINSIINIEVEEIEKINILNSSLKAMKLACENVISKARLTDFMTFVDGNKLIKNYKYPQKYIVKGDGKSASVAAASILAKVSRDRYMKELAEEFPQYRWEKNAGYLTAEHLAAIDKFGLTKYHRASFLRKHFEKQLTLF